MPKLTKNQIKKFQPFTGVRSVLWSKSFTYSEAGSVGHEREVPEGAVVVGYAFPEKGGYRVEWV